MVASKLRVSHAAAEYLTRKRYAANTEANYKSLFNLLTETVGDVYLENLTPTHIDRFLARYDDPATSNARVSQLRTFLAWCQRNGHVRHNIAMNFDTRPVMKEGAVTKHRIPLEDWPRILDIAGEQHPLNRAVVALGLYLGQRGNELGAIKLMDITFDPDGRAVAIKVTRTKTSQVAEVPVFEELADEIDLWLAWYKKKEGDQFGNLPPNAYLLPRRRRSAKQLGGGGGLDKDTGVHPMQQIGKMYLIVQQVLKASGWYKPREGSHTLRRSVAVALYKADIDAGFAEALDNVKTFLGHSSVQTTEIYLGTSMSQARLRERVAGKRLAAPKETVADNVVELRRSRG